MVTRFQVTCWSLGVFAMWVASDYPIHDIAERYNFSVHMVQHLIFTMVVAPLLLLGLPGAGCCAGCSRRDWLFDTVRTLSRFIPALIIFNVVLVFTHWPLIVNEALTSGLVHFLIHALLLVSSLIVWMPIVSPLPEIPRLAPVMQMLYLFAWSVVPTVPASFLTFGASPLYKFYEARAAPVRAVDARGSADRRLDHENRCRTPTLGSHRRSVLPLGLRGGTCEHPAARTRRDGP